MNPNEVIQGKELQEKILKGVNIMANTVAITLGPRGRNVGFTRSAQKQVFGRDIVHDGVSVARAINLSDESVYFSGAVLREASQKTVDEVGDGTTVTIVLAQSILNEALQIVATGVNPMSLRKGLEDGVERLITELDKYSKPVKTLEDEIHIATISSEDDELGKLVGQTLNDIGIDGVVTVEESKTADTLVEKQKGLQFDKGYLHPLFITDPREQIAVAENTYVLITDKPITSLADLGNVLNDVAGRGSHLTIISTSIAGEALPLLIQNKLSGKLAVLAVQAPSFGQNQKNILQDIAVLTDGTFITEDAGHEFKDITISDLGFAEHITSTKSETIIVGGRGEAKIEERAKAIKKQMEDEDDEFEKEKLKERYAKLTNGVAVIKVGGHTEIEMKERKERVIDAVAATKAAMEKGIVAGGEIVFLDIRKVLGDSITDKILFRALEAPFNKLMENAGIDAGQMKEKLSNQPANYGVDVIDGEVKDMLKEGIIDPLLVPQRALYNAVSVALQLMMTGAIIVPEKDEMPNLQDK